MEQFIKGEFDAQDKLNKNFKEIETSLSEKAKQSDLAQLSNQNLLINGDFQVWQRGTLFSSGGKQYTADRWALNKLGWATGATGEPFNNWFGTEYLIRSTGNTSSQVFLQQILDVPISKNLRGKKLTLSYKARTGGVSGTTLVARIGGYKAGATAIGNGVSYSLNPITTINLSGTQGYYITTTTVDVPLDVENIIVYFECGITGTTSEHYVAISEVKLEVGTVATPFIPRDTGEELRLCQRYYETCNSLINVMCNSNTDLSGFRFKVSKRITPTITFKAQSGTTFNNQLSQWGNSATINITGFSVGTDGISYMNQTGGVVGNRYVGYYTADAEIY